MGAGPKLFPVRKQTEPEAQFYGVETRIAIA